MKKKVLTMLLAGVLGSTALVSGSVCTFAAETEAETSEDMALNIGEDAEGAFHVMLTNLTGKDIKAVKIVTDSDNLKYDEEENLLQEEDVFAAEEERMLCYLPETEEETEADKEETEAKPVVYNIQFTFADDTTAEIHTFPFGDVEASEIHLEGEIGYLVFESVSQKKEINTLETETEIAETVKAQKEAAAAAAASAASSNNYYDSYEDNTTYDYSGSSSAGNGGNAGGGDQCLTGGILN